MVAADSSRTCNNNADLASFFFRSQGAGKHDIYGKGKTVQPASAFRIPGGLIGRAQTLLREPWNTTIPVNRGERMSALRPQEGFRRASQGVRDYESW